MGARVIPSPHPQGSLLVYSGDSDGSLVEVWPAATRGPVGADHLVQNDLPLPEQWPHHAFITSDTCTADQILAVFEREGWTASLAQNGPPHLGFSLVRGWIENHQCIELGGTEMRARYETFIQAAAAR